MIKRKTITPEEHKKNKLETIIMKGLLLEKYKIKAGEKIMRNGGECSIISITQSNDFVAQREGGKKLPITFHSCTFEEKFGRDLLQEFKESEEWETYKKRSEFREQMKNLREIHESKEEKIEDY